MKASSAARSGPGPAEFTITQSIRNIVTAHYGWVIVFVTFCLTGLCYGGVGLVAVLMKPLASEFGWQRGQISMAYTLATAATAFAGVVCGRLADLYGVRMLAAVGSITIAVSLLLLSQLTSLWHLYAAYTLFGALGFGAISIPLAALVTNWFSEHRGLALGIVTAGGAVGQGVVPYIANAIVVDLDWRAAYLYLGLAYLLVAVPLALLVRNPPSVESPTARGPAAIHDESCGPISPKEALTWICTASIFCCICMSVPIMHGVALANDAGLSVGQAAKVLTILMLAGATGRVIIGRLADRFGPLRTYMFASFGQTATVFWFTQVSTPLGFYIVAVLFGISFGGVMTSFILTVRSLVPTRIAATSMSLVLLFAWIGMAVGAYMAGLLFDWTQTYVFSFAGAMVSGLVNLAIVSLLAVRLRRERNEPSPVFAGP
ncbi:MAG: MFS transporter [Methyloligellaceae bacterium]